MNSGEIGPPLPRTLWTRLAPTSAGWADNRRGQSSKAKRRAERAAQAPPPCRHRHANPAVVALFHSPGLVSKAKSGKHCLFRLLGGPGVLALLAPQATPREGEQAPWQARFAAFQGGCGNQRARTRRSASLRTRVTTARPVSGGGQDTNGEGGPGQLGRPTTDAQGCI